MVRDTTSIIITLKINLSVTAPYKKIVTPFFTTTVNTIVNSTLLIMLKVSLSMPLGIAIAVIISSFIWLVIYFTLTA